MSSSWLFQPTTPESDPPWSPSVGRRSTLDLVQACVLTLILCSWTAVHPDIPTGEMQRKWKYEKLLCALCALLAPEIILWIAFDELWESRLIYLELEAESKIEVIFPANPLSSNSNQNTDEGWIKTSMPRLWRTLCGTWRTLCGTWRTLCRPWHMVFPPGLEGGFYIEMGGFELVSALSEERDLPSEFKGRVTPRGAIELAQHGLLPVVPLALINDQSKSDKLAKFLVCLQAGWMIAQCIARVAQSLPLTLLELHTVMHAVYAFLIFLVWIKKPHDVMVTTKVKVDDKMLKILEGIVRDESPGFKLIEPVKSRTMAVERSSCGLSQSKKSPISESVMACLAFPLYGGVHLAAWNVHFPSNLERILWIASAISIAGLPFMTIAVEFLLTWIRNHIIGPRPDSESYLTSLKNQKTWGRWTVYLLLVTLDRISLVFWMLARIYLFVESFASLRSLPRGSYKSVSWVSFIPHF